MPHSRRLIAFTVALLLGIVAVFVVSSNETAERRSATTTGSGSNAPPQPAR